MSAGLPTEQNDQISTRIVGLAGRKRSGKDATARFIHAYNLVIHGVIDEFITMDDGTILIDGIQYSNLNDFAPGLCQVYHFADPLKEICTNLFGISKESLYGDKSVLTEYTWDDMPNVIGNERLYNAVDKMIKRRAITTSDQYYSFIHNSGRMTVRDFLQYFGTEIARKINTDCWLNATLANIQRDQPKLAIIADVRFKNELDAIRRCGGLTIKLTRHIEEDSHVSENDIDSFHDWDVIIDNAGCNNNRCLNKLVYEGLSPHGLFSHIE